MPADDRFAHTLAVLFFGVGESAWRHARLGLLLNYCVLKLRAFDYFVICETVSSVSTCWINSKLRAHTMCHSHSYTCESKNEHRKRRSVGVDVRSQPLVIGAERLRHRSATDRAVPRQEAGRTVGAPDLVRVSNHRVRVKVRVRAQTSAASKARSEPGSKLAGRRGSSG